MNKNKIKIRKTMIDREVIGVSENDENERIDSYLAKKLELTRTRVQQLIKEEKIKVNGRKTKSSYRVELNDRIEAEIPRAENIEIEAENIEIDIIYEDPDIAVVNKQAGLVVHPAHGHYSGTLVNAIMYHIKDLSGINGEIRPGIVHRLDKDTSGLIIIAKNDRAHNELSRMFSEKEISKTYIAILKGKVNKERGRIETQIGRDRNDRKKMTVLNDPSTGKRAVTNYEVLDRNELFSLVRVNIETGRTHQIRVHAKYLGYPILGDFTYGRSDSEKRQMLHAYRLEFLHPVTRERMKFIGELPKDFRNALKKTGLDFKEIQDETE